MQRRVEKIDGHKMGALAVILFIALLSGCSNAEKGSVVGGTGGAAIGALVTGDAGGAGSGEGYLVGKVADRPNWCRYRNTNGRLYTAKCDGLVRNVQVGGYYCQFSKITLDIDPDDAKLTLETGRIVRNEPSNVIWAMIPCTIEENSVALLISKIGFKAVTVRVLRNLDAVKLRLQPS